jgi:SecD/SecF fusion protein
MGSRRVNLFVILFVIGLLIASGIVIASKPTVLGLDLRGGTQLVYQAEGTPANPEPSPEDVDRALEIVRDRVDSLGVAEPEISRVGADSIQVGLPDVQDSGRAQQRVGDTAQLYFYDFEPNVIPLDGGNERVTASNVQNQAAPSLYDAVKLASEQPEDCNDCTALESRYYLFDGETEELVAGPETERADLFIEPEAKELPKAQREVLEVKPGTIVVRDALLSGDRDEGGGEDSGPTADRYFVLRDEPALSGDDIRNPEQNFDPQGNAPNVTFDFTDEGRRIFQEVTRGIAERGRINSFPPVPEAFAIVLDDELISRPVIDPEENPDGIDGRTGAQISGGFTITEAQDLAEFLRIGALPVELKLISTSTVSATLGKQALDQALLAGIVALVLVLLFLIAFYRFLGVVAALGLIAYATFFFALLKLIPITLTLPGIAGLILTIGVAADSNIVIFERIKEEVRGGHSMISAITTGYKKGIATIIDANVITLLTAFVLFGLATGGVKGFAFTLGVGILVSLFTAVVFTRAVLGAMSRSRVLANPRLMGAGRPAKRWHFDFAGASRWFFSLSGAILLIGAISFATNQLNFGIDFESGTRIKAALSEPVNVDAVRDSLAEAGVEEPDSAKIQVVEEPDFGDNVVQIQGKIDPELVAGPVRDQLETDFGLETGTEDVEGQGGFVNDTVGPTFGEQVARSAAWAIAFSLLLIAAYVAFRFEAKYAVPVMIAVIHDILITAGVYSLVGAEVSSATVAAFLTILGLSLYDTVIVFDRIRENVPRLPRATFAQIANRSLSEVLTRSLVTSVTTLFAIGMLLVFGGETLGDFAFAMFIGILSGFYSSLFIATPVLIAWKDREPGYRARAARIEEAMGYVPAFPEENIVAKVDGEDDGAEGGAEAGSGGAIATDTDFSGGDSRGEAGRAEREEPEAVAVGAGDDEDPDGDLTPEELAERERKREIRERRKAKRQARRRKHGRPR